MFVIHCDGLQEKEQHVDFLSYSVSTENIKKKYQFSFHDEKERRGQFKGLGSVVSSGGKEDVGRFEQMSADSIQKYLGEGCSGMLARESLKFKTFEMQFAAL